MHMFQSKYLYLGTKTTIQNKLVIDENILYFFVVLVVERERKGRRGEKRIRRRVGHAIGVPLYCVERGPD